MHKTLFRMPYFPTFYLASQLLTLLLIRLPRYESATDVHVGRGGAANTVHVPAEEIEAGQRDKRKLEATVSRVSQSDETHDDESTTNAGEKSKAVNWIKKKLNMKEGSNSNRPTSA